MAEDLQGSTFNTVHVMDNEIIKANDFEFAFKQIVDNIAKSTQMFLESTQDFVINGKVLPDSGRTVKVAPIYGVCKSEGKPFGRTEEHSIGMSFDSTDSIRVDVLEVAGEWVTYDNQQRAFNDPDTNVQTYQYVDTKQLLKPVYQIVKGVDGSTVAPEKSDGFVKLAEVVIRSGQDISTDDIKNITADVAGMNNDDWTTEKSATYNIGYISDVNARFRVAHNEDGTHKDDCINADMLDIGIGAGQVNGNVLPIGTSISDIPTQTANTSNDAIALIISRIVALITSLYNSYLKYSNSLNNLYGVKGEFCVSAIADENNVLTKPIKLSADGSGNATIKVDNATVLTIDINGKLHTNGYSIIAADNGNTIVTKAVTDAINTALNTLKGRVDEIETELDTTTYANATLSAGTDGRYNVDSTSIVAATTQNVTLSGNQSPIDGVTITSGQYILVKAQTDATENGIYQYLDNAAWQRVNDFLKPNDLKGKLFTVTNGTVNGKKMFYLPEVHFNSENPDGAGESFGYDDIEFLEYFGAVLPAPDRLAMRDSNGCVKTALPQSSNDSVTKNYVDPIIITTNTKTISGPTLSSGMHLKILFTANITGSNTTTALSLTYNGASIPVKITRGGTLQNIYAHEISTGTIRYIQAYTTIEVIYYGSNFVVVGNPVVLSSLDYTVYADGKVGDEAVGTVKEQATTDIPYGWLECNGQAVSRTTYKPLFDKFNSQSLLSVYGVGNNSTTFNVPDYSETSPVGRGTNVRDTIATHDTYTIGQFKDDQMQGHTHYIGRMDNPGNIRLGARQASVSGTGIAIADWKNGASSTDGQTYGMMAGRYNNQNDVTRGKRKGIIYIIKAL